VRIGMAAAGLLLGIGIGFVLAICLFAAGHVGVSFERSVFGGAVIGVATGLVYPAQVASLAQGVAHFFFGAVAASAGEVGGSSEESAPWLKVAAKAGSLVSIITLVALWLFG
jgi:hypothetical protein